MDERLDRIEKELNEIKNDFPRWLEKLGVYIHEVANLQRDTFRQIRLGLEELTGQVQGTLAMVRIHERRINDHENRLNGLEGEGK